MSTTVPLSEPDDGEDLGRRSEELGNLCDQNAVVYNAICYCLTL